MNSHDARRDEDRDGDDRVFANPNATNRRLARRVVDAALNGDRAALDDALGEGYVLHAPAWVGAAKGERPAFDRRSAADPGAAGSDPSHRDAPHYVTALRAAFPDLEATLDDQFGAGDRVVSRLTMTGTHRGELFGVAGTGRQITFTGTVIHRLADGAVVEEWAEIDPSAIARGIGGSPDEFR